MSTLFPDLMSKVASQIRREDIHHALDHMPLTNDRAKAQQVLEQRLRDAPSPKPLSWAGRTGGQAVLGSLAGALTGSAVKALSRGKLRHGTSWGALLGGTAGAVEANTPQGRRRHAKFHRGNVEAWKRTRDPAYRRKVIAAALEGMEG